MAFMVAGGGDVRYIQSQPTKKPCKTPIFTIYFRVILKSTSVKKTTFRTPFLGVSAIFEIVFLSL